MDKNTHFCIRDTGVALLIPALNPDEHLLELLCKLTGCWYGPVVVVDDGSEAAIRESVFTKVKDMGAVVVTHACNLGKGRALKTGLNECLNRFQDLKGVVTADADGQHLPEDICACAEAVRAYPDCLILGCRDFAQRGIPLKSSMGNKLTRATMKLFCGVSVTDTQTGLRGIPAGFMRALLVVDGEYFDFETNMLLETAKWKLEIKEIPIQTVYLEQNRASHFRPIRDSLRIYALFAKYIASALIGFVVDITLFSLLISLLGIAEGPKIVVATVIARMISAVVNFTINHGMVFRSDKKVKGCMLRYALLCVVQMCVSAAMVVMLHGIFGNIPSVGLKVFVDTVLFFISFQVQKYWVF